VVTGASSGIGKATAELLASRGWRVFAGVRTQTAADDVRALNAAMIQPITIDVTSAAGVRAAADEVAAAVGDAGLQGLVNNAGLGIFLPVEAFTEEAWSTVFEVNVNGVLRSTQAFLPLLRAGERRGRVVNMSSIAGSVSFPMFAVRGGKRRLFCLRAF
jgi:NAD(P)-dependent dehydrogenase (short-subunit alcohol dehydrogenase family)